MNTSTADGTLVIGAGIVGICCGLSLLEKGEKVTIIDRDDPGQGASYGNAGVISPWSNVPQSLPGVWKSIPKWLLDPEGPVAVRPGYLPKAMPWAIRFLRAGMPEKVTAISDAMAQLTRPSIDLYRHHLKGTGHEGLVRDSWYLHIYRRADEADLGGAAGRLRERHATPAEIIYGDQIREIEPALSPDFKAAIVIRDQARAIAPGRIGKVLADKDSKPGRRSAARHRAPPQARRRKLDRRDELGRVGGAKGRSGRGCMVGTVAETSWAAPALGGGARLPPRFQEPWRGPQQLHNGGRKKIRDELHGNRDPQRRHGRVRRPRRASGLPACAHPYAAHKAYAARYQYRRAWRSGWACDRPSRTACPVSASCRGFPACSLRSVTLTTVSVWRRGQGVSWPTWSPR